MSTLSNGLGPLRPLANTHAIWTLLSQSTSSITHRPAGVRRCESDNKRVSRARVVAMCVYGVGSGALRSCKYESHTEEQVGGGVEFHLQSLWVSGNCAAGSDAIVWFVLAL